MLVERHASWVALNNVVGCPNNCIYCFLNEKKSCAPLKVADAKSAVETLLKSEYYNKDDAICIMPNTDIFATPSNIKQFFLVCSELKKRNIKNLVTIITKREINTKNAQIIKAFRKYLNICVYVSYSGLEPDFEKGIRKNNEVEAITSMKNLKSHNIPCIHYWRPLLPQNSDEKTLQQVFDIVKHYCIASCMTGLKLYKNMSCQSYWPEAQKAFDNGINPECFVPKGSFDKIINLAIKNNYSVYVDNVCLMAEIMNKPCSYGIYKNYRCEKYNICSKKQRQICGEFYGFKKPQNIEITGEKSLNDIINIAKIQKAHISGNNKNSTYWQSSFTNKEWLEL